MRREIKANESSFQLLNNHMGDYFFCRLAKIIVLNMPSFSYIFRVERLREGFSLKTYIEERAVEVANFIIKSNATVRETAKKFGISKSTVHKDVTERLKKINPMLAIEAKKVLEINKSERHIRGGLATKEKYLTLTGHARLKSFK